MPGALTLRRPGLHPVTVELLVDGETSSPSTRRSSSGSRRGRRRRADERRHRRRRARPRTGADRRPRSPTAATACHRSPSRPPPSTARSPCSCRPCCSTASPPTTPRSPPSCARRSTATRCSRCRPTCSTRRRPWRSTPRATSTASCATARTSSTDALPSSLPQRAAWLVPTPISTDAAALLRQPRLPLPRARPRRLRRARRQHRRVPRHHARASTSTSASAGRSLPARRRPGQRAARPGRRSTHRHGARRRRRPDRRRARDDAPRARRATCGAAPCSRTPAGTVPDADVAAAVATFATQRARASPGAALGAAGTTDTMIVGDADPETVILPATAGPDLADRAQRIDLTRVAAAAPGRCSLDHTPGRDVARRAGHAAVDRAQRRRGRRRARPHLAPRPPRSAPRSRRPRRSRSRSPAARARCG